MRNKIICFSFTVILGFLVVNTSCSPYSLDFLCGHASETEAEAKEYAKKRLARYCKMEGIDITEFVEPVIYKGDKGEEFPWIFEYTSKKNSEGVVHFFKVALDNCGRTDENYYEKQQSSIE